MEEKKRKPINSDLFILACLTVIVLIFALFFNTCTLFRSTYAEGGPGKCMAISIFGKLELKNIDKAIITRNGEEWTITDTELIDEIIGETRIATYVDSECHEDCCGCEEPHYQVELYRKDKLIRAMEWQSCCNSMRIYEEDLTHWLIGGKAGYVMLSNDLYDKLDALIALHIQGNE